MHVHRHTCIYIYVYIYIYMYKQINMYIYIYIYVCVCIYIYINIHIQMRRDANWWFMQKAALLHSCRGGQQERSCSFCRLLSHAAPVGGERSLLGQRNF